MSTRPEFAGQFSKSEAASQAKLMTRAAALYAANAQNGVPRPQHFDPAFRARSDEAWWLAEAERCLAAARRWQAIADGDDE